MKFKSLSISFLLFTFLFGFQSEISATSLMQLQSPDKKIRVNLLLNNKQILEYSIVRIENGKTIQVLDNSPLGIVRADQSFAKGLTLVNQSEVLKINEKLCRHSHGAKS